MTVSEDQSIDAPKKRAHWFIRGLRYFALGLLWQVGCLALLIGHHKLGLWPRSSEEDFWTLIFAVTLAAVAIWPLLLVVLFLRWMRLIGE